MILTNIAYIANIFDNASLEKSSFVKGVQFFLEGIAFPLGMCCFKALGN